MEAALQNPFRHRPSRSRAFEKSAFWIFRLATYLVLICGLTILGNIAIKGSGKVFKSTPPFINTDFLLKSPETLYVFEYKGAKREMGATEYRAFLESESAAAKAANQPAPDFGHVESIVYSAGGIFPCIIGTLLLVVGSMTIALLLGVASAIYLSEYAKQGAWVNSIRLAIVNLAGVPSIVFGLFGYGMFVILMHWNVSLLAGWFTLAFMVLPVVITASEEALRAVPKGFREGSLALGATKWQTIRKAVLPYALPGILTSSILGIARVAGETAPIMFTAAYVMRDKLPWQIERAGDFVFQGVMALPYHIYVVSSKIPQNEYTERVQYGTAFVFLAIVAAIAAASIILRNRLRHRLKW
ncbi:MAG TPA: phosphate ABC transporter permease PstA [Opitutaceae bacterium]|nr:phosphate ABC transporter permease PstA [Opitutaceae bacterium]